MPRMTSGMAAFARSWLPHRDTLTEDLEAEASKHHRRFHRQLTPQRQDRADLAAVVHRRPRVWDSERRAPHPKAPSHQENAFRQAVLLRAGPLPVTALMQLIQAPSTPKLVSVAPFPDKDEVEHRDWSERHARILLRRAPLETGKHLSVRPPLSGRLTSGWLGRLRSGRNRLSLSPGWQPGFTAQPVPLRLRQKRFPCLTMWVGESDRCRLHSTVCGFLKIVLLCPVGNTNKRGGSP